MIHPFWNQVYQVPDEQMFVDRKCAPAVTCTYGELKNKIDQFRWFFKDQEFTNPGAVAVIADQTPSSYAFFLACFFSSVTPVVIPAHVSASTQSFLLRYAKESRGVSQVFRIDSGCGFSESEAQQAGLKVVDVRKLDLSSLGSDLTKDLPPPLAPADEQLAWVLFTSGTSGRPKPILIPWRAVNSFTQSLLKFHVFSRGERVSQSYVPSFDPYFADLLGAVLQGATLVPFYSSDAVDLPTKINAEMLSHWSSTPSLANIGLMRLPKALGSLPSLRRTVFTGEPLSWDLVKQWRQLAPFSSIENLYGPTETTIWISRHVVSPAEPKVYGEHPTATVPIGKLFPGHTYELGANSELIISGPQVCVQDGVQSDRHSTGDIVQSVRDGDLCWIGRADYQVKLRGHRIQLDVIEEVFSSAVNSKVTLAIDSKNLSLTIFSVVEIPKANLLRGLSALGEHLPPALVPKSASKIDFFPVYPNGKRMRNSDEIMQAVGGADVSKSVSLLTIKYFPRWILENEFPLFFYSEDRLQQNFKMLKSFLHSFSPRGKIFFSVKSNPHPEVLRSLAAWVDGFDVSSQGEHRHVLSAVGLPMITASGPAKTDGWFQSIKARPIDVLHLDNLEEWSIVKSQPLLAKSYTLRIARDGLGAQKLGFSTPDVEQVLESIRNGKATQLTGFHIYLGREAFSWKTLAGTLAHMKQLFDRFPDCFQAKRAFIGAGLPPGSSLEKIFSDRSDDDDFARARDLAAEINVDFEVGRALVHSAGTYVCSVISVKQRLGRQVVILNGGLQHLASSLTSPTYGHSEMQVAIWRKGQGLISNERDDRTNQEVEFYGSLGTWSDRLLSSAWRSAPVQAGDRIVFSPAGAYGVTAASSEFIALEPVREFFQKVDGEVSEHSIANFYLPYENDPA